MRYTRPSCAQLCTYLPHVLLFSTARVALRKNGCTASISCKQLHNSCMSCYQANQKTQKQEIKSGKLLCLAQNGDDWLCCCSLNQNRKAVRSARSVSANGWRVPPKGIAFITTYPKHIQEKWQLDSRLRRTLSSLLPFFIVELLTV